MNATVYHKAFGDGTVTKIEDNLIEIAFGEQIKKFQFPKAFDTFLKTDDMELLKRIDEERAKQKNNEKPKDTKPLINTQDENHRFTPRKQRAVSSPLVGERAQTIAIQSEEEMFELVGYMAAPGRISSIEAEVPRDGRDDTFERLFPGQIYRPIEMGNTPSGMPNKLSSQFRINFANLDNCPDILLKNMGKGVGSCVGRVNKSKFVLDIVQNYGFRFGDKQDTDTIRQIASRRGFLESFERGYKR